MTPRRALACQRYIGKKQPCAMLLRSCSKGAGSGQKPQREKYKIETGSITTEYGICVRSSIIGFCFLNIFYFCHLYKLSNTYFKFGQSHSTLCSTWNTMLNQSMMLSLEVLRSYTLKPGASYVTNCRSVTSFCIGWQSIFGPRF